MPNRRIRSLAVGAGALLSLGLVMPLAHADPKPGKTGTFTALTYNVAGLPEGLSSSHPATNSPLISPLLDAYDLVLLQENFADPLEDQREAGLVPDEVPRLGYHDQVVAQAHHAYRSEAAPTPPMPALERFPTGPALTADGLNRLSQFSFGPLTRVMWDECNGELATTVGEEALKQSGLDDVLDDNGFGIVNDEVDGGATDCAAQKGFSVATTELGPGVQVDIYNLHAEAGNGDADQAASRAGFAQLADYIVTHSAGKAIILGGDTNLHSGPNGRAWEDEVWNDFLAVTGLTYVCDAEGIDCGADDGRIDKFAFRSGDGINIIPQRAAFQTERFLDDGGEPLSDHDPLAVTFKWVRTGKV